MTAGTVQPNPSNNGRNALPDNPRLLIISSMTNATRDMYPLSSKSARARRRMKMFGRNVRIPPTPEMMPSTINEVNIGLVWTAARPFDTRFENTSRAISKYPFIQSPTVNVRKNTNAMIRRKIGRPSHFPVRYLSILSVEAAFWALLTSTSSIISSIKSYF